MCADTLQLPKPAEDAAANDEERGISKSPRAREAGKSAVVMPFRGSQMPAAVSKMPPPVNVYEHSTVAALREVRRVIKSPVQPRGEKCPKCRGSGKCQTCNSAALHSMMSNTTPCKDCGGGGDAYSGDYRSGDGLCHYGCVSGSMAVPEPECGGIKVRINRVLGHKIVWPDGEVEYTSASRPVVRAIAQVCAGVAYPGVGLAIRVWLSGPSGKWNTKAKAQELAEMRAKGLRWALREDGCLRRGTDGFWGGTPIQIDANGNAGVETFDIYVLPADDVRKIEDAEIQDEPDYLYEELADIALPPSIPSTRACRKLVTVVAGKK